jgi:hypothetical protein
MHFENWCQQMTAFTVYVLMGITIDHDITEQISKIKYLYMYNSFTEILLFFLPGFGGLFGFLLSLAPLYLSNRLSYDYKCMNYSETITYIYYGGFNFR